jgi:hypothetical protein
MRLGSEQNDQGQNAQQNKCNDTGAQTSHHLAAGIRM